MNIQPITDYSSFDSKTFMSDGLYYNIINDTIAPFEVEITYTWGAVSSFNTKNYTELTTLDIPSTVEYQGVVYNVTRVGKQAFYNAQKLQRVVMSENIKTIGAFAFANTSEMRSSLSEVTCYATTPPVMRDRESEDEYPAFLGVSVSEMPLYVPTGSIDAYEEANQWKEFGQILPIEQTPEDLFPTLWGLQRTGCTKTIGENENGTVWGSRSYLMQEIETATIDGKQYLLFGINDIYSYDEYCSLWLREENNKILVYSTAQKKDLVLYDFTLNVGDSLSRLYVDYDLSSVVDYDNDEWGLSPLVVTEVSTITLLDGKEYKKWTFNNGMQYVEGIGSFGTCYAHNDFYQLIANAPLYSDVHSQHLVCVSKNNKLLYQMDDAEMERLGAECLCDYDRGPRKDNAKNGKIGGRPTPTQWNQLELDLREMENGNTILRAETFSYTLENDSIVANNKTYYQLARQSTKDTAITKSFVGALHFGEDEDNRVYFFRDGHEYVLYDFTAEPGDTLEIFAGINNYPQDSTYTHVVIGKDTIENGACRMTLEVVFPNQTSGYDLQKVWLAGLGSIDGIVHNAASRASNARSSEIQTSVMLCAWRDDDCLYTTDHPDYDTLGCVYNTESTGVGNTISSTSYQKILRNGQLLILHQGRIYNVIGVEIK